MIRVLLAVGQQVLREGLRVMLSGNTEIEVVGYATNIPETIRLVGELQPSVLLIDPHMHHQDGLQALRLIRGEWPQVALIAFTVLESEEQIPRFLQLGVSAYLTMSVESSALVHAIRTAARGELLLQPGHITRLLARIDAPAPHEQGPPVQQKEALILTEREREVLQRVANGERNKEIAARLGISEPTVKSHLASIYFKLGVDSRASAVVVAIECGLLSLQKRNALKKFPLL